MLGGQRARSVEPVGLAASSFTTVSLAPPLVSVCAIESEIAAVDHSIVVLRIHDLQSDTTVAPLVFHGSTYRRLAS